MYSKAILSPGSYCADFFYKSNPLLLIVTMRSTVTKLSRIIFIYNF